MQLVRALLTLSLAAGAIGCEHRSAPTMPTPQSVVSGTVKDDGGGPVARATVYVEPFGPSTTTADDGSFSVSAASPRALRFTAPDFDDIGVQVTASAQVVVHVRMRRSLKIGVNAALSFTLAATDPIEARTFFGYSWCEPCRVLKIQSDSRREIDVTVRWSAPAALGVWIPDRQEMTWAKDTSFTARENVDAGDTMVYVGSVFYAGPPVLDSLQFDVVTRER